MKLSYKCILQRLHQFSRNISILIVVVSLSNSTIFQYLDSSDRDAIEFLENCPESDEESQSEKEGADDEFLGMLFMRGHFNVTSVGLIQRHYRYYSSAAVDIYTPPPEFI